MTDRDETLEVLNGHLGEIRALRERLDQVVQHLGSDLGDVVVDVVNEVERAKADLLELEEQVSGRIAEALSI